MESHESSDVASGKGKQKTGEKLLQDPLALAAALKEAQERENFIHTLPPAVRRRVNALKKLQLDAVNIEAEFYRKVHDLECDYAERFVTLTDKRKLIVIGSHEPTDDECKVPIDEDELAEELSAKATLQNGPEGEKDVATTGIPEFWLTTFKNVDIIAEMIQEHDEPILKHLTDVEVKTSKEPMLFTFIFHFSPNEYFTNATLTKEYILKCQPDPKDPFEFDGPEIVDCKGCKIDWKPTKNVTVKLIKKKQKHKQKGATRFVTKEVKNDSFFNFFDPAVVPEGGEEELDDETRELMNADFEIGQILRDRILPRAVLYYTGEAADDDDYDEEEDEEDEDDLDEEDESEEENSNPKV
jgi:nucleosome assembly protein 1-like 1